jgi:beta-lactamase class D
MNSAGTPAPTLVVSVPSGSGFDSAFAAAGVTGTCILYDPATGSYFGHGPHRWDSSYIPASTFKIPNSLFALEAGVIADENTVIPWDSVSRMRAAWNRDHTMKSAFRESVVWFYQVLARRIGATRMQQFLDVAEYGNRTMGGPIDAFWLDGGIRITPRQQLRFLERLRNGDLPFSRTAQEKVLDIMVQERAGRYVLRAKTGWSDASEPGVGWYVGYVERGLRVLYFATEIDITAERDLPARIDVTRAILRRVGMID